MKKSERIELQERYLANWDEVDDLQERKGLSRKEAMRSAEFRYRRTYPKISEIDRPIEIQGNKKECKVKFFAGYTITVRISYDDLCIKLNDLEHGTLSYMWEGN